MSQLWPAAANTFSFKVSRFQGLFKALCPWGFEAKIIQTKYKRKIKTTKNMFEAFKAQQLPHYKYLYT